MFFKQEKGIQQMKRNCGHIDSISLIDISLYFRLYYTIFSQNFNELRCFAVHFRYIAIMRCREKRNTSYTITTFNDIVKNSCCTNMSNTFTNTVIHTQIYTQIYTFCLIYTKIRSMFCLYCDTSTNRTTNRTTIRPRIVFVKRKKKQKKRLIKENKE